MARWFLLPLLLFSFLLPINHPVALAEKGSAKSDTKLPDVQTYEQLVKAIRQVRHDSQVRLQDAVEQENVREAWETGYLIMTHLYQHPERADYGEQVLQRLSKETGLSVRELRYRVEFAREYPIRPVPAELSWSHYREMLALNDEGERKEVEAQAVKEHWNSMRVREEVHRRNPKAAAEKPEVMPEIKPGKPGTYRLIRAKAGPLKGELAFDLGFSTYLAVKTVTDKTFIEGDIVTLPSPQPSPRGRGGSSGGQTIEIPSPRGRGQGEGETNPNVEANNYSPLQLSGDATESDLYTYLATVLNVIDGDTFHVLIDLGFGIVTEEKLRLRRVDAPEIISREGAEAKAVLEKILSRAKDGKILIKTTQSDQFGRYLADIWTGGRNINQELLDSGVFEIRSEYGEN